jgi:hypothetical protein
MRTIITNAARQATPAPTAPYRIFADHPEKNVHQISNANNAAGQTNRIDILKCVGSSHHIVHKTD